MLGLSFLLASIALLVTASGSFISAGDSSFSIGPLEFASELSSDGKYVQVKVTLNSVLVAATIMTPEKKDYTYDVIVGTSKSQGTLHAAFDNSSIAADLVVQVTGQSDNKFSGNIFQWTAPVKPMPPKPLVAPALPKPYYIGSLSVNADLQKDDVLHVVITSSALPLAAFTLSAKQKEHKFDVIIGSLTASGTVTHAMDKDGISSLLIDMVFQQPRSGLGAFRGAVFFWSAASATSVLSLPSGQPFYLGTQTQVVCTLKNVDTVAVVDTSIVISALLADLSTLTATQPSWWYDVTIGLTATNGTLVANFSPQGDISSVMGDLMLYQSGQAPQPYRGGVFFWIKA